MRRQTFQEKKLCVRREGGMSCLRRVIKFTSVLWTAIVWRNWGAFGAACLCSCQLILGCCYRAISCNQFMTCVYT